MSEPALTPAPRTALTEGPRREHRQHRDPAPEAAQPVPVLPLRDVVVYPHMVIPLFVGREKSILALDLAMRADKQILLVAQKPADVDDPKADDLYRVGTRRDDPAAAEAPGRHRQGAGRGREPRHASSGS